MNARRVAEDKLRHVQRALDGATEIVSSCKAIAAARDKLRLEAEQHDSESESAAAQHALTVETAKLKMSLRQLSKAVVMGAVVAAAQIRTFLAYLLCTSDRAVVARFALAKTVSAEVSDELLQAVISAVWECGAEPRRIVTDGAFGKWREGRPGRPPTTLRGEIREGLRVGQNKVDQITAEAQRIFMLESDESEG